MAKRVTYRVSQAVITRANSRTKPHGVGSVVASAILSNASPSREIDVSVKYSGKVISQRLTSQDVRSAYKSAIEGISHGKKVQ